METETTTFTIEGLPDYDNGTANVHIEWADDAVDWGVFVENAAGETVGTAASLDNPEMVELIDPMPGVYTVVVRNFEGGETSDWRGFVDFDSPTPATYSGLKEAWTMTCSWRGDDRSTHSVIVDRRDAINVGRACRAAAKR